MLEYQLMGLAKENDVLVNPASWLIKSYHIYASFQILRKQYYILDRKLMLRILKFSLMVYNILQNHMMLPRHLNNNKKSSFPHVTNKLK